MNIVEVMEELSKKRSVFHSEADFQHSLGWMIREMFSDAMVWPEVRSFYPIEVVSGKRKRRSLDLLVRRGRRTYAIELKYKTAEVNGGQPFSADDTEFIIPREAACDLGRYDFLADLVRLEREVSKRTDLTGHAILLTNDSDYWHPPAKPPTTKDREFRIHSGRKLPRRMDWQSGTAESTKKGRRAPIRLKGEYPIIWRRYQTISGSKNTEFWYLQMKVT